MKGANMDLTAFCNYLELKPGVVIYFKDRAGKTRTEVVFDRTGENLKVRNALKKMTIVNVKNIIGYWDKDVKATRQNMINFKKEMV